MMDDGATLRKEEGKEGGKKERKGGLGGGGVALSPTGVEKCIPAGNRTLDIYLVRYDNLDVGKVVLPLNTDVRRLSDELLYRCTTGKKKFMVVFLGNFHRCILKSA